jgi:hypothetical protein
MPHTAIADAAQVVQVQPGVVVSKVTIATRTWTSRCSRSMERGPD